MNFSENYAFRYNKKSKVTYHWTSHAVYFPLSFTARMKRTKNLFYLLHRIWMTSNMTQVRCMKYKNSYCLFEKESHTHRRDSLL